MKEFNAQTGGRYTYADDLENLQNLALAFSQIFDNCDNFIVSGCEVYSKSISAGYVFLNGKLRYFSGVSQIESWPQYIYETNYTENVAYESGGYKVGRNVYGCSIGQSVPSETTQLTGEAPQSIVIDADGGLRMKDAFIGKYALLLDPESNSQTVDSIVNFAKALNVNDVFTARNGITIESGAFRTEIQYNDGTLIAKYIGGSNNYQLSITDNAGIKVYANDKLIATINENAISFNTPVYGSECTFGGVAIKGGQIYQGGANGVAEIGINMRSYNGASTQYRNTYIGDGKGKALIGIIGSASSVDLFGRTTISTGAIDGLVLKANKQKDSLDLINTIAWSDSADETMARIGFIYDNANTFSINVSSYDIAIEGHRTVNIGPAIKENGVLLSDKYVSKATFDSSMTLKANIVDVEPKISDTGWKRVIENVYVRQIGKVVCIQGDMTTVAEGTAFTLPDSITPPAHAVTQTIVFDNNRIWVGTINKGSRKCNVSYCSGGRGRTAIISFTYMI